MGIIKGQNLRIKVNGLCIAAAKSCQLHISAATESISNKDVTDGWDKIMPIGNNWDASADAMVMSDNMTYLETLADEECLIDIDGTEETVYAVNEAFALVAGQTLHVKTSSNGTLYIATGNPTEGLVMVASSSTGLISYTADAATSVYIAHSLDEADILYIEHSEDYDQVNINVGDEVDVELDVTTGTQNRTTSTVMLTGSAYITDFTINAQNRQIGTYSVKLTGTSSLS